MIEFMYKIIIIVVPFISILSQNKMNLLKICKKSQISYALLFVIHLFGGVSSPHINYYPIQDNSSVSASGDECWSAAFQSQGLNGRVLALEQNGEYLFAGGIFSRAGGVNCNNIARWNGVNWDAMGNGVIGVQSVSVDAIVAYDGKIYASGLFSYAGSVEANNIACWDGSQWTSLGPGTNGQVLTMAIWNGDLYIGGYFTQAGNMSAEHIARWDGNNWHPVGGGISGGKVRDIAVWNGLLYIGGQFEKAGTVIVNNIAAWNGSFWSSLSGGVDNSVYVLYGGYYGLYVGGKFIKAGDVTLNRFGRWDGSQWINFGNGLNNYPLAITKNNQGIVVGGAFTKAGDSDANSIAYLTGDYQWHAMGSGLGGGSFPFAESLLAWGSQLYIGGGFTTAGLKASYYIALWKEGNTEYTPFVFEKESGLYDLRASDGTIILIKDASVGCAWGDYDNDSDWDLFVANDNNQNNSLYQNQGDGTFIQIFDQPMVSDGGNSKGGIWGDYDHDGDLDLFVVNYGEKNILYKNFGGAFEAVLTGAIVEDVENSTSASWADYDNDGFLDLMVTNSNQNNSLYHNQGDGNFIKIIEGTIVNDGGDSWGLGWADVDRDGDLDLYIANIGYNFFYINQGNGQFVKDTGSLLAGANYAESIGCSWGDYDNDGYPDLLVTNSGQEDYLFHNLGNGQFEKNISSPMSTLLKRSRGSGWCDFDNDGYQDLFILRMGDHKNSVYINNSIHEFVEYEMLNFDSWGGSCCDYDNNGISSLFATVWNGYNLFLDPVDLKNNWLQIRCIGTVSDTWGIGAKIWVKTTIHDEEMWQMREISSVSGYGGQSAMIACFGLESSEYADSVRIEWQSGVIWDTTQVMANQMLYINEPASVVEKYSPVANPDTLIIDTFSPVQIHVLDNDYDPDGGIVNICGFDTTSTLGQIDWAPGDTVLSYFPAYDFSITQDRFFYVIMDAQGLSDTSSVVIIYDIQCTGISQAQNVPKTYQLYANVPNPFNPSTTISFDLPENTAIELEIINLLGEHISTLIRQNLPAGRHQVIWEGRNDFGMQISSGVYLYRLKAAHFYQIRKMIYLR